MNGVTFTGSYAVGMDILKNFVQDVPKPVIAEMGGKNPAIVTKNADLDVATDGVLRSAFGFGGQKCSANSRVYVEREVYDDFVKLLKDKTEKLKVGNPIERDVFMGPVVNEEAMNTFEQAAGEAKKNGNVITGGERLTDGDLERGLFVQPTIVEAPDDSWLWKKELFVPFLAVAPFDELDDAIEKANDTEYGLTAGFFSKDRHEIEEWLDKIQAGRRVREPARRRHDRRLAGRAAVRRLEGVGDDRQGRRRSLLRHPVPARAVPDGDRRVSLEDLELEGLANGGPRLVTELPGSAGAGKSSSGTGARRRPRSRAPTRSRRSEAPGSRRGGRRRQPLPRR